MRWVSRRHDFFRYEQVFIQPMRPCEREHVRKSKRRRLNIKGILAKLRFAAPALAARLAVANFEPRPFSA
jgi:hypothetical protein